MSNVTNRPGRRFQMLLYERLYQLVRWPLWLIALGLAVLWWRAPFVSYLAPIEDWLLYAGGLCLGVWAVMSVMRGRSYVQCYPRHVRIQTPLLRLALSYQRVHTVRPVVFKEMHPSSEQRWSQRHYLEPFYNRTAVGVTVSSYPMSLGMLRLLLGEYMFTHDAPGFMFVVDDWMTLSRQIDVYRDRWRDTQARAAHPASISLNPFMDRQEDRR